MKQRIVMITLLAASIAAGTVWFSAVAMAHDNTGMMRTHDRNVERAPCMNQAYSETMHHGDGHRMMGSMMRHEGMGAMMSDGHGSHMMDSDDMRHGGMLGSADKLGLSDDQVRTLKTLRLTAKKDIIQKGAELKVTRLELSELLVTDNWALEDTEPLVNKIESLESDIHLRHLQALIDARKVLTTDQFKQYSSSGHLSKGHYYCN